MPVSTPRGGGSYSHFSLCVGLGPASTVHPKKYQEFQEPPKIIFEILTTKKIYPILYIDVKKIP